MAARGPPRVDEPAARATATPGDDHQQRRRDQQRDVRQEYG
ncbi:hypothetical protein [Nonomuraea antri]|nr:hypothetical protein [Nonomuraea antri]